VLTALIVFILLTRPDGVPVAINSDHIVAVSYSTLMCPDRTNSYILTDSNFASQCVRENYDQIMEKLK
jgi:hypothetical protein